MDAETSPIKKFVAYYLNNYNPHVRDEVLSTIQLRGSNNPLNELIGKCLLDMCADTPIEKTSFSGFWELSSFYQTLDLLYLEKEDYCWWEIRDAQVNQLMNVLALENSTSIVLPIVEDCIKLIQNGETNMNDIATNGVTKHELKLNFMVNLLFFEHPEEVNELLLKNIHLFKWNVMRRKILQHFCTHEQFFQLFSVEYSLHWLSQESDLIIRSALCMILIQKDAVSVEILQELLIQNLLVVEENGLRVKETQSEYSATCCKTILKYLKRHHNDTLYDIVTNNPIVFEALRASFDRYSWLYSRKLRQIFLDMIDSTSDPLILLYHIQKSILDIQHSFDHDDIDNIDDSDDSDNNNYNNNNSTSEETIRKIQSDLQSILDDIDCNNQLYWKDPYPLACLVFAILNYYDHFNSMEHFLMNLLRRHKRLPQMIIARTLLALGDVDPNTDEIQALFYEILEVCGNIFSDHTVDIVQCLRYYTESSRIWENINSKYMEFFEKPVSHYMKMEQREESLVSLTINTIVSEMQNQSIEMDKLPIELQEHLKTARRKEEKSIDQAHQVLALSCRYNDTSKLFLEKALDYYLPIHLNDDIPVDLEEQRIKAKRLFNVIAYRLNVQQADAFHFLQALHSRTSPKVYGDFHNIFEFKSGRSSSHIEFRVAVERLLFFRMPSYVGSGLTNVYNIAITLGDYTDDDKLGLTSALIKLFEWYEGFVHHNLQVIEQYFTPLIRSDWQDCSFYFWKVVCIFFKKDVLDWKYFYIHGSKYFQENSFPALEWNYLADINERTREDFLYAIQAYSTRTNAPPIINLSGESIAGDGNLKHF